MRRIAVCLLMILIFCGCVAMESDADCVLLTQAEWEGKDLQCTNHISFGEDGSFCNSCACGSPVGNGDVAEEFRYDADDHTISLLDGEDEVIETGKVLYVDDTYLVIDLWDSIYAYENLNVYRPDVQECALEYTGTDELTKACLTVLNYENDALTVSAYDYDGDAADEFTVWELPASEDIIFTSVSITDDNGEVTMETMTLPESEYMYIADYYGSGYFEFNQQGEVSSVVAYGELIIQG